MSKNLKKILVTGATILMVASVGAEADSLVKPVHAHSLIYRYWHTPTGKLHHGITLGGHYYPSNTKLYNTNYATGEYEASMGPSPYAPRYKIPAWARRKGHAHHRKYRHHIIKHHYRRVTKRRTRRHYRHNIRKARKRSRRHVKWARVRRIFNKSGKRLRKSKARRYYRKRNHRRFTRKIRGHKFARAKRIRRNRKRKQVVDNLGNQENQNNNAYQDSVNNTTSSEQNNFNYQPAAIPSTPASMSTTTSYQPTVAPQSSSAPVASSASTPQPIFTDAKRNMLNSKIDQWQSQVNRDRNMQNIYSHYGLNGIANSWGNSANRVQTAINTLQNTLNKY